MQRRVAQPVLHEHGDHHEHAGRAGEVDGDQQGAAREAAGLEQAQVHHRGAAPSCVAGLPPRPEGGQADADGHEHEPPRPEPPVQEREHDGHEGAGQQDDADRVQVRTPRPLGDGARQPLAGHDQGAEGDGHVHQKGRAPAEVAAEPRDEPAAEQRPHRHGHPDDGAERPERPGAGGAGELALDEAGDLRVEQARAHAHDQAREHEQDARGRQAGQERTEREHAEAHQEQPAAAEEVTRPARRHEHHAEHEGVAGDGPLQLRVTGVQAPLQGGQGHVDAGHGQQGHEDRDEEHREDALLVRGEDRGRGAVGRTRGDGHAVSFTRVSRALSRIGPRPASCQVRGSSARCGARRP